MAGFDKKPRLIKKPCGLKELLNAVNEVRRERMVNKDFLL